MNSTAWKVLLWKEWRESRTRWFLFLMAFHIPMMIILAKLGLNDELRVRLFLNSDDSHLVSNLLELVNLQYLFTMTIGAFLIAFYAASAVVPEFEDRRIFYLIEQPLQRSEILRLKFLFGAVQAFGMICIPVLVIFSVCYFLIVAGAKDLTFLGSSSFFFQAWIRTARDLALTCSMGLSIYSGAFLLSLVFEKWWIGVIVGSLSLFGILFLSSGTLHGALLQNSRNSNFDAPLLFAALFLVLTIGLYQSSQAIFQKREI